MAIGDWLDVRGAASGQATPLQPEERQMQRIQRMVSAAESSNYDGDPEYYNQIKAIAMQAGIPIKGFKTNPFRLAKVGLMSMADPALLGLLPNELYTPEGGHVNPYEAAADAGGMIAGSVLPWGLPARLAKGGMAALGAGGGVGAKDALAKLMTNPRMKAFKEGFLRQTPSATAATTAAAPVATTTATKTAAKKISGNVYKSPGGAKPKTPTQKASDAKSRAAVISKGAAKVTKTTAMSVEAFAKLAKRNVAKAKAILRNLGVKTGKTSNPRILAAKFRQYKARNK